MFFLVSGVDVSLVCFPLVEGAIDDDDGDLANNKRLGPYGEDRGAKR